MERTIRYQRLPDDEQGEAAATVPVVGVSSVTDTPPPIVSEEPESSDIESAENNAIPTTEPAIPHLPSYSVATSLPTYEEAEESKKQEAEQEEQRRLTSNDSRTVRELNGQEIELGTDALFIATFIFSFLFNWIGLLASLCLTQTIAGRMGALSGFGLSMVKWVAIVKHNNWGEGVAEADSWIWWMLIIMGLLIFVRGCLQYVRIRYQWNRFPGIRERFYFNI
ncbi:hypothetical protein CAPTEDRAFT_172679 [Capitella teleta]|uniref:Uncharacterized protein n=1 Tax=Capitella teleta TaxID=283909 RepID=R7TEL9_CAPTE|nr:hypothetical protein CAPTEDRAFT_172679 [Capitella teleta]|eukprot:ELT89511.1 hypothetical protein CAPTEDRAFT_172679 [Capitella teleta]